MDIYTVSFFGHKEIENWCEIESRLENMIQKLIAQKEYIEFLVGRDGEFDLLVSSVIRRVVRSCGYGNTSFVLVLPYMRAEYRDNEKNHLDYYDEIEICTKSSQAHYKSAIQIRNKCMVDRSDLVICYIREKSGGAYKTVQYAKKQRCRVVNLMDIN